MTDSEIFEYVTGSGSSDFSLLASILNRHGDWCLIGGLAINCYVEPVYTLDADIVVAASRSGVIKLDLEAAGFGVEEFPDSINARMPGSDLRIRLTTDPRYQAFLEATQAMTVLGQIIPVASIPNLVQGKIWAWQDKRRRPSKRKKDELDLIRILETYPDLRHLMPTQIKNQVP